MSEDITACAGCTATSAVVEPPRLVAADGGWRVSCPACGKRGPLFLDRDYSIRAWNRGDRKKP